jgi:ribose transport system permease protein
MIMTDKGTSRTDGAAIKKRVRDWLLDHITYVIFGCVTIYFLFAAPNFATLGTAAAILRITAIVSVMAVGMTFVIVCAEIDLSVGSLASLSGMIAALLMERGMPVPVAVFSTLLAGTAIGVFNGILVTRFRIPSFLVTLGMLSVLSGIALTMTNTRPVPIIDDSYSDSLWNGSLLGAPAPIWWTLLIAVTGYYILQQTPFGRRIYATGGNMVAAQFSGVRTDRVKIIAFSFCSFTATFSGLMLAARSTAGNPSLGAGMELDVIAAVIIGGTSLFGGHGTVPGSVIGAIFIGIVGFGLLVMGFSTSIQEIIKGAIIIAAVALSRR